MPVPFRAPSGVLKRLDVGEQRQSVVSGTAQRARSEVQLKPVGDLPSHTKSTTRAGRTGAGRELGGDLRCLERTTFATAASKAPRNATAIWRICPHGERAIRTFLGPLGPKRRVSASALAQEPRAPRVRRSSSPHCPGGRPKRERLRWHRRLLDATREPPGSLFLCRTSNDEAVNALANRRGAAIIAVSRGSSAERDSRDPASSHPIRQ